MDTTLDTNGGSSQRAWIHFFKFEANRVRLQGVGKVCRATIAEKWKKLTKEEKRQFGTMPNDLVLDVGESSMVKTHKEQKHEDKHDKLILSRCRVSAFIKVVSTFSLEQQAAIKEIGFGSILDLRCGRLRQELCETLVQQCDTKRISIVLHGREFCLNPTTFSIIMGIKDGGEPIDIREEVGDITELRAKYKTGRRGIEIAAVSDKLIASESYDDEFKILFSLFLLGTVLCPTSATYINPMYLHALKDVQSIRKKNWATWCFNFLWKGISKYKEQQVKSISGCLVFLELLYFTAVLYDRCTIERTICPISVWTKEEIRRFLNWQKKYGDITSSKVPMHEAKFFQPQSYLPQFKHMQDAGLSAINMEAVFRVLTESVQRIEHKMDSFNVRMEMVEKSLEELRAKCPVGAPPKQPPDLSSSLTFKSPEPTCPLGKPQPTTNGKNKMIMISDDDFMEQRLNLHINKLMAWTGASEVVGEIRKEPSYFVRGYASIPPFALQDEDIDEPVDLRQEPQTTTRVSKLPPRPIRNHRLGRYRTSPYDQWRANIKYKAGPFQVNALISLD